MALHDKNQPLYMISVAAELTGMHPQTLRIYETKGLVTPSRSQGNTRLYSQNDIERLNLIARLTDEGVNLAGVVRILDMRERLEQKETELDQARERILKLEEEMHEYKVRAKVAQMVCTDHALPGSSVTLAGLLMQSSQARMNDDDSTQVIDDDQSGPVEVSAVERTDE